MPMGSNCESCGAAPPIVEDGTFREQRASFDYCEHCSADLCPNCMANKACDESPDRLHHPSAEFEEGGN